MAGRPITRAYHARIEEQGGGRMLLDRIASGDRVADISRRTGVSRAFLSFYLHTMPGGKAAVWLARCIAAEGAARRALEQAASGQWRGRRGPKDALEWIAGRGGLPPAEHTDQGSASLGASTSELGRLHLDSLRRVERQERLGMAQAPAGSIGFADLLRKR